MKKKFKNIITYFILYVMKIGFDYLFRWYEVYYDFDEEALIVENKKECLTNEESSQ